MQIVSRFHIVVTRPKCYNLSRHYKVSLKPFVKTERTKKMKKLLTMISAAFAVHAAFGGDYPYSSAALTNVTVTGGFWLPSFETNRLVTLKADFEKCELERIPNFRRAAAHEWGTFKGVRFDDSDVFKVIEGAAYTLAIHPDRNWRNTWTE